MGFFSKFENKMEDTFDNIGDKMFDSPISPVQIAKKSEKQMRRNKMLGAGKQYAPTLYTVLVNKDDDARLFGYYPTLAGETETYLEAKANEAGLAMDGHPLVRFIVDEDLKHGKFDVIAEAVAGSIVEQLRAEENERYGIKNPQAQGSQAPNNQVAGQQNFTAAPNAQPKNQMSQNPNAQPQANNANNQNQASAPGYASPFAPFDPNSPQQNDNDNFNQEFPPNDGHNSVQENSDAGKEETQNPQRFQAEQANLNSSNAPDVKQAPAYAPQPSPQPRPQEMPPQNPVPANNNIDNSSRSNINEQQNQFANYNNQAYNAQQNDGGQSPQEQFGIPAASCPTAVFAGGLNINPNNNSAQPGYGSQPPAHLRDVATGKVYTLNSSTIVIGRDNTCNIVIPDVNASRQHAQILYDNGVWMLNDLGSTNGTYINNYEVSSGQLNSGDVITIGVTNLSFNVG